MTFDELWRLDLEQPRAVTDSGGEEEGDLFDERNSGHPALDELDDEEVSRFLEWLEMNLLSGA